MQTWRCKCGNRKYYESGMPPRDCQGCEECGTTYAQSPEGHKPLQPHTWKPQFDRNTGEPTRPICSQCGARGHASQGAQ